MDASSRPLPEEIWYVPGLPCRKCGRTEWNTFQIATRPPPNRGSSGGEYSDTVTEWRCGVTGRVDADRADEQGIVQVQAFCCDCGHLWWSRHPAARRYARRVRAHCANPDLHGVFASWEQVESENEWTALNDECRQMLHDHRERAARRAAELRVARLLEHYSVSAEPGYAGPRDHRFVAGRCFECGREQYLAERFGWPCA
jgi:hypothetical protein